MNQFDKFDKPISRIRDMMPHAWPDAQGSIEIFNETDPTPLESIMYPPYGLDFMFGPEVKQRSIMALLTLSEPLGYDLVLKRFILPNHNKPIRIHYALKRNIPSGRIPEGDEVVPSYREAVVLDLSFSAIIKNWGVKRYTLQKMSSYNLLLGNLKDCKLPNFKEPQAPE